MLVAVEVAVEAAAVEAEAVEAVVVEWAEEEAPAHILNLMGLLTVHSKAQQHSNNKGSDKDTAIGIVISRVRCNNQVSRLFPLNNKCQVVFNKITQLSEFVNLLILQLI
jgi:hypothetical protein